MFYGGGINSMVAKLNNNEEQIFIFSSKTKRKNKKFQFEQNKTTVIFYFVIF